MNTKRNCDKKKKKLDGNYTQNNTRHGSTEIFLSSIIPYNM